MKEFLWLKIQKENITKCKTIPWQVYTRNIYDLTDKYAFRRTAWQKQNLANSGNWNEWRDETQNEANARSITATRAREDGKTPQTIKFYIALLYWRVKINVTSMKSKK